MINPNNYYLRMDEKYYHTTLYPLMCTNRSKDIDNNSNNINYFDTESIFGIEASFVDIQTPILRYQAWIHFIQVFN